MWYWSTVFTELIFSSFLIEKRFWSSGYQKGNEVTNTSKAPKYGNYSAAKYLLQSLLLLEKPYPVGTALVPSAGWPETVHTASLGPGRWSAAAWFHPSAWKRGLTALAKIQLAD